jgi:hypothetical protein
MIIETDKFRAWNSWTYKYEIWNFESESENMQLETRYITDEKPSPCQFVVYRFSAWQWLHHGAYN